MLDKICNIINFFGLWIPYFGVGGYYAYSKGIVGNFDPSIAKTIFWWSLFLMLLNCMINSVTYANGKRRYHMFDALNYRTDPYMRPSNKLKAKYPPVNDKLKYKEPTGIVLGRKGKRYVCVDFNSGGSKSTMILGESGCGKTSTVVLDTILALKNTVVMAVDVKSELYKKGTMPDDPKVIVISPVQRRGFWGYDPFFLIRKHTDLNKVASDIRDIAFSLIPVNPKDSNPFWRDSARDLLNAALLFFYKRGCDNLIDIVDEISSSKIEDVIEMIYNEAEEGSVERKLIARYVGMASETLSGINAQMMSAISVYINDADIRYMLKDNPLKANPTMLDNGKSIYVYIPEEKLEAYATVLQLILNQTISYMETRPEGSAPILMIIDELPRIVSGGKLSKLENGLETLRSRNVTLMLIAQSLEALERAYTKSEVQSMLTNCPYKVILSASSPSTQDAVIRWAGKYEEIKHSRSTTGSKRSTSVSYEWRDIVEASDLITLPDEGEVIIICPYGYMRLKKVPYYKDRYLNEKAEAIKAARDKGGDIDG